MHWGLKHWWENACASYNYASLTSLSSTEEPFVLWRAATSFTSVSLVIHPNFYCKINAYEYCVGVILWNCTGMTKSNNHEQWHFQLHQSEGPPLWDYLFDFKSCNKTFQKHSLQFYLLKHSANYLKGGRRTLADLMCIFTQCNTKLSSFYTEVIKDTKSSLTSVKHIHFDLIAVSLLWILFYSFLTYVHMKNDVHLIPFINVKVLNMDMSKKL